MIGTRGGSAMIENKDMLNNDELEQVSGGDGRLEDEEARRREAERKLHGKIVKDAFGNVTFTDKTGVTGTFSAADWGKLMTNWSYTGAPEYFMETINVGELNGVLQNMN